jgi:hypothetical protein
VKVGKPFYKKLIRRTDCFVSLLQTEFGFFVPPLMFGVAPLLAILLCLLLPETANAKLPDTLEEGEDFGKYV